MKRWSLFLSVIAIIALQFHGGLAYSAADDNADKSLLPSKTSAPPKIDGNLDDEIWQQVQPLSKYFIAFEPIYGEALPQKTTVWMAYDSKNLYFAFLCYDTEPEKIKTSITKRDNIWADDHIGVNLDSLGNKQSAYGFFLNPNGIQGDGLYSVSDAQHFTADPDFVWYSAGRITEDGYQVEMRIPLRSIRFNSGEEIRMGILFVRSVSRLGLTASWPEIKPGYGRFNVLANVDYGRLKSPLNLELLPSFVYGRNSARINPDDWGEAEEFNNIGMDLKYGITSSMTADITLNPDFSQVESDAFQVEVNQKFPIFYSEKRPFFLEGVGIFSFSIIPRGHMSTAVHTRRIVDPNWGTKLTGSSRKAAFGILAAGDQWPGAVWGDEVNPYEGKTANFTIVRGKYNLGGENFIGGLYSGREFAGGYNRVAGVDFMHRFFTHHQARISFLQSYSQELDGKENAKDSGFNFYYEYNTKPFLVEFGYERYGANFRMDSAFQQRIGISRGWMWITPSFYPNPEKISWLKKFSPQLIVEYLYDYTTGLSDKFVRPRIDFNFTKQGYIRFDYALYSESWINQTFKVRYFNLSGNVQITNWLYFNAYLNRGDRIYYDRVNPYLGWGRTASIYFSLQPNDKLNQVFDYSYTDFYRKSDDEKIYEVNIVNSRTTYQFNKYFFVRAILQYDSYQRKLLSDFLGSCTIIPGTVLHLGYGALYQKRDWQDNQWVNNGFGDMLNMKRSFFFKASYLWRF